MFSPIIRFHLQRTGKAYMKLFITPGSPYARMARITVVEKGLEGAVEIVVAQTRAAGSPYYSIHPSGRRFTGRGCGLGGAAA